MINYRNLNTHTPMLPPRFPNPQPLVLKRGGVSTRLEYYRYKHTTYPLVPYYQEWGLLGRLFSTPAYFKNVEL